MDQQVKDILELLEYQNERLKKALRGNGAFYTYVYIACPDMDALSVAQASAKSTWQNEYAMTQPIQVLDLCDEEQQHLLYHFRAFSADVTRENIAGVSDYKYATVLLPNEYKDMQQTSDSFNGGKKKAGNDTLDAYSRLLERLSCFARPYSIEYRLFSAEDNFSDPNSTGLGLGVDELIGGDDVTVFESFGLESTFANFIFGIITSGFYKVAKGFERGYLNPAQYETVLVIEEANKVLTGNDTAGTGGGGGMASLSGQSEFEEILDQSAGYGLFIIAITQKISMMPSSIRNYP